MHDTNHTNDRVSRFFAALIDRRWYVVAVYALLLPPSAYFAARVKQDNSIDRLITSSDADYLATRDFQKIFGSGEFALLLVESDAPLSLASIARVDRIERAVQALPQVAANSALTVFRRAHAGFEPTDAESEGFRNFVHGTDLLRRQGLVGDRFLAIGLVLDVSSSEQRAQTLTRVDQLIEASARPGPPQIVHRLGQPYVNVYLDDTLRSSWQYFALFLAFVVVLTLGLYRSWRTLTAFLITLAVCLVASLGYIGITGGTLTIVSPMVPMTILVTATATLVYVHSRFVERPAGHSVAAHQVFALRNKLVPCTASIFATASGFAALTVSNIRPVYQMGVWVAVGLTCTWVIVFTLFPALQTLLRTPTAQEHAVAVRFEHFIAWLPRFTYRWRWALVGTALAISGLGAAAIFGVPGVVARVPILTDPVEYMSHSAPLYRDIQQLQPIIPGLSVTQVWLKGPLGSVSEPAALSGLNEFQQALEGDPEVGAVVGLTSGLRMFRYVSGEGDAWPTDRATVERLAADLEGLVPAEPMLQRFVQPHSLGQTQLTVISRSGEYEAFQRLDASIRRHWREAVAQQPALRVFELRIVGLNPLHARMAENLVPTLVESFALTVVIIFGAFVLVFRSGTARLMALIPSLFALLAMFLVMRLAGMRLNIATILIASTVLGTSENDQIHFFYHFLEKRRQADVEEALRHTLRIAGRAILFATLINAGGFLAFAFSDLPPIRQFGVLAAAAFVLSMLADFTALPAALWILSRAQPRASRRAA